MESGDFRGGLVDNDHVLRMKSEQQNNEKLTERVATCFQTCMHVRVLPLMTRLTTRAAPEEREHALVDAGEHPLRHDEPSMIHRVV